jgi:DNA modification methylase
MVKATLAELSTLNLDFHREASTYSSHALHAFAAKFPPQIPGTFIESLTKAGETVLDPMNGSGTTTLEAYLLKRRGIGCDIDPLAVKIARVKATPLEMDPFKINPGILKNANKFLRDKESVDGAMDGRFDMKTRQFIDYWFYPGTARELMALLLAIEGYKEGTPIREFLEVMFSSIIVTKSGGVSRARDLAHSRPHLDPGKKPKNAIKAFEQRLIKFAPIISGLPDHEPHAIIRQCDAKKLWLEDGSVHLIVTSPPYANAIDYMRANKFSLAWLGRSITDLGRMRGSYIGSEATRNVKMGRLPSFTERILRQLRDKDGKKEAILRKYLLEMRDTMGEMHRVLAPGRYAILVVGTSTMRGIDVKTPYCLADIAEKHVGFELTGIKSRSLDRDKRMMPFAGGRTRIEQRMGTEEVVILKKA